MAGVTTERLELIVKLQPGKQEGNSLHEETTSHQHLQHPQILPAPLKRPQPLPAPQAGGRGFRAGLTPSSQPGFEPNPRRNGAGEGTGDKQESSVLQKLNIPPKDKPTALSNNFWPVKHLILCQIPADWKGRFP